MRGSALRVRENEQMCLLLQNWKGLFFSTVCSCLPFLVMCADAPLYLSIKAFHKRELPNKFYCEKPQTCPEIGCQSTKIFKPRNFTVHMKAEHGDPKDIKCTEHKVCQAKEPKKLYNAFTLSRHIIEYNAGVKQKEKKQPCDHSDCRGLTKQRTPRMLIYHKKMNHGEAKTLPCSYHDLCKRRYRPKLYNAYGLVRHQKIVEQRLKEILNATRCTHSDCSQDETLYPKTEMKHHWKAEHGEKKGLWCTKHLDCKYQSKQYNSYTYGLHMKHREYASRRKSSDSARKCTHPKCVRSRRKLTQRQMQNHWKTSHGGPATSCEVHEGCRDSSLRYNKHTLPIHIASVRREEQSKKQGPWLKCSSPICVDNTKEYHPRALVEHQRRHDKQKIYECKEKDCEDGDKLFDKKTFQEHQFQHAMRNRGCASCDHDDCRGSPLLFEEAMLVDHKLEYHQTKQCERCTHVDCQGSENVYNLWTMAEHMLRHRAPESLSLDSEDEFEDEQEDDESAEVAFNFETDCDFDDQDHDKEVGDQDFDDIFDDLDYEDQNKPDSNDQSENADSEEALGQFKKHETPNAHLTEEANPDIVIDETPRPLQIIRVEASENEPVSWTVRKTYCPVVNCRLNKPDAIAINDLPLHVEDIHGLSRRDPRLRLYASIICTFPGCKKTISPLSLTGHVNGAHNEFDAVRCSHADCKHNQCLYTPRQKKIHMLTHAPKTLKCNEPGCEDSDLLYNEKSLRGHIYRHPIKLFCPFRDCGTPLRSCSNMHSHVFIQHNIQTTLANLKAAACTAFNVCLPGQLKMEAHSSPRDDLTSASERQLEHFLQDHVRKSKVGSAQMDDDQDGALDGNRSLEFEEKEAGEVLMSIEECDGDSEDGDSDEDVSDDSEELAHGSDPATLVETHEIGAMLNCASSVRSSRPSISCEKLC